MDWTVFWATVSGTLAGALVGAQGVRWVFHLESRNRYRERLDDALGRVIVELAAYNERVQAFQATDMAEVLATPRRQPPSKLSVLSSMEVALMFSRGEDFEILNRLVHGSYNSIANAHMGLAAQANGIIIGAIERWRCGQWNKEKVLSSFDSAAAFASRIPPQ